METVRYGYTPEHPGTFQEDFEPVQSDLAGEPSEALCPYSTKNQQPWMIESSEESSGELIHALFLREYLPQTLKKSKEANVKVKTREIESSRTEK